MFNCSNSCCNFGRSLSINLFCHFFDFSLCASECLSCFRKFCLKSSLLSWWSFEKLLSKLCNFLLYCKLLLQCSLSGWISGRLNGRCKFCSSFTFNTKSNFVVVFGSSFQCDFSLSKFDLNLCSLCWSSFLKCSSEFLNFLCSLKTNYKSSLSFWISNSFKRCFDCSNLFLKCSCFLSFNS